MSKLELQFTIRGRCSVQKMLIKSFPMMSVFKLHQAVAILHCLKQDSLTLKKPMLITKDMLSPDTYVHYGINIQMEIFD